MRVIQTTDKICVMFTDGVTLTATPSNNPAFAKVRAAVLAKDESAARSLMDVKRTVTLWADGAFQIRDDGVFANGVRLPTVLEQRVLDTYNAGLPVGPLIRFSARLAANPSNHVATQLYTFLENRNIPLGEDGVFYCYKAIRQDYMDMHSGTFRNMIGDRPTMPRSEVDDNPNRTCSHGLHVGALPYVQMFGGSQGRVMIVKVDPADVVSVPVDYNGQKMRVCRYEVVSEYTGPLPDTQYGVSDSLDSDYDPEDDSWADEDDVTEDPCEEDDGPFCPFCGEAVDPDWDYCAACGREQPVR